MKCSYGKSSIQQRRIQINVIDKKLMYVNQAQVIIWKIMYVIQEVMMKMEEVQVQYQIVNLLSMEFVLNVKILIISNKEQQIVSIQK